MIFIFSNQIKGYVEVDYVIDKILSFFNNVSYRACVQFAEFEKIIRARDINISY